MTQIMELMEKRAKAWEAAKAFLNTHSQNGGMVSAEDAATYDKMEKEVTDLTRDIERLQRQDEIEKMLNQPTSAPITNIPGKTGDKADENNPAGLPLLTRRLSGTTSVIPAILSFVTYWRKAPMATAATLFLSNSSTPL
jgi:HK97 family phage major capsid protein